MILVRKDDLAPIHVEELGLAEQERKQDLIGSEGDGGSSGGDLRHQEQLSPGFFHHITYKKKMKCALQSECRRPI